jgi:rhodanese-related sulfurtransferase
MRAAGKSTMSWLKRIFGGSASRAPQVPTPDELLDMVRLSPLFKDVPEKNIRDMLGQADAGPVREGDVIFSEGDVGDFYYIVLDGMVSIERQIEGQKEPKVVAVLAPGYSFGEEALIANATRTSTTRMQTDGMLLRVPKAAFIDYLMVSIVTPITPIEAQRRVNAGAKWLDVRNETERSRSHLPGSLALPIEALRDGTPDLDKSIPYICYCDTGRRGTTAAFLLRQNGYDACVLQGGLNLLDRQQKRR